MSRDPRGGNRLLSVVALLVAIGGLVLAASALPMLTAEAPAGGSLEESAEADGAGEEVIERTDPETAGAAGSAAAGAASGEAGAAGADPDPDEATVEEIREGVGDSDAGTALLGVAAVFATVGGAGEELPADAIDGEDVEDVEGLGGYGEGQQRERGAGDDLGVPPGLGELGGELGDLAAESAPEGEDGRAGEGPTTGPGDVEGIGGDSEGETTDSVEESGDAADSGTDAGSDAAGSGLFGAIPGGGMTVAAAFSALLALAVGVALRGGADARLIPGLFVSAVLGWVVAVSRGLERARSALAGLEPRELPGAIIGVLAAIRARLGRGGGDRGPIPPEAAGDDPATDGASGARGRIREAFSAVVAASALSRSRARVATPGEVARRAIETGSPREPVATITDAFRDVEYGGADPEERVKRASQASEEIAERGEEE